MTDGGIYRTGLYTTLRLLCGRYDLVCTRTDLTHQRAHKRVRACVRRCVHACCTFPFVPPARGIETEDWCYLVHSAGRDSWRGNETLHKYLRRKHVRKCCLDTLGTDITAIEDTENTLSCGLCVEPAAGIACLRGVQAIVVVTWLGFRQWMEDQTTW